MTGYGQIQTGACSACSSGAANAGILVVFAVVVFLIAWFFISGATRDATG